MKKIYETCEYGNLLSYIKEVKSNYKVIVFEGVRGAGKSTLINRITDDLSVDLPKPFVYRVFKDRKKFDFVGVNLKASDSCFFLLDTLSGMMEQKQEPSLTLMDRGYLTTCVFENATHSRLALFHNLCKAVGVLHIYVHLCINKIESVAKERTDVGLSDLFLEYKYYEREFSSRSYHTDLSYIRYGNYERCKCLESQSRSVAVSCSSFVGKGYERGEPKGSLSHTPLSWSE